MATIGAIREYGGRAEFRDTQRLMFEMVLFIESGESTHEIDFASYRLAAGDVLWVHAGQVQRWGDIDDIDGVICMFDATLFDEPTTALMRRLGGWTNPHRRAAADTGRADDFRTLLDAYRRMEAADPVIAGAVLAHRTAATLLPVLASSAAPGDESAADERISGFRDDVDRFCTRDRSVGFYARRLGMSERSLHRLVSERLGTAPKKVIEERLILEAKRLLVHGGAPVSSVARALGFDDPSNFAKFFRTATGTSPSAFREANPRRRPAGSGLS